MKGGNHNRMAAIMEHLCECPESKLSSTFLLAELTAETSVKCCVPDKPVC